MELVSGNAVVDWVCNSINHDPSTVAMGIGLLDKGNLIAGAVYEGYTGTNIFMHMCIAKPVTKEFWQAIFSYPFDDLRVNRITAYMMEANTKVIELSKHVGFKEEGRLKGAAHDGTDMVASVMWKDDCKMLKWRKKNANHAH